MKRAMMALAGALALAAALLSIPAGAESRGPWGCKAIESAVAGGYQMDAHDISSSMFLYEDGRWDMNFFYRDDERYESGCWQVKGDRLVLSPRHRKATATAWHPSQEAFDGVAFRIEGRSLVWDLGHGRTGAFKPV